MPSIKTNMLAWNANRQLNLTTKKIAKNSEKLSSGYKINRAADDAAGLAISEKMRRQIRGLHQGAENIQDGIGYVQTADGALNETQVILQRMNELAVKSANGTNTKDDRAYIDQEIQALKEELDRIFDTTSFNEIKIWEPTDAVVLGYEKRQAVDFNGTPGHYVSTDITNKNCGIVPKSGYSIAADKDGMEISWTGYSDKTYTTKKIDWETIKQNKYQIEISDYFKETDTELFDTSSGQPVPVLKHSFSMSVQEEATLEDIIAAVDKTNIWAYPTVTMTGQFEKPDGSAQRYTGVRYYSASLNYSAAYASYVNDNQNGHNFDAQDLDFLEAKTTGGTNLIDSPPADISVEDARTSTDVWKFKFYMEGIGDVTAESRSTSYYAYDQTKDDEGFWWHYYSNSKDKYQIWYPRNGSLDGTLGSVMAALTGDKNDSSPGLLNKGLNGAADSGGCIELSFTLKADQKYIYGNDKHEETAVGSFSIRIDVSNTDTEDSVLTKIKNALNDSTIFDLYRSSAGWDANHTSYARANERKIDVPIYGGACNFFVQAGAEAGQHIDITYDSLSLLKLGLADTNVLTVKDSDNAINEIKAALETISDQRATFGAYQNRLEHARKINENSEENTQYAESVIRDTDIADEMMEYSVNSILSQAGTSMLTQANQQSNYMLQLLQ